MFGMLTNLTKAVVSVAVTPVTLAADVAMMPFDATENKDMFSRTGDMLSNAKDCLDEAVKPDKSE